MKSTLELTRPSQGTPFQWKSSRVYIYVDLQRLDRVTIYRKIYVYNDLALMMPIDLSFHTGSVLLYSGHCKWAAFTTGPVEQEGLRGQMIPSDLVWIWRTPFLIKWPSTIDFPHRDLQILADLDPRPFSSKWPSISVRPPRAGGSKIIQSSTIVSPPIFWTFCRPFVRTMSVHLAKK